MLKTLIKIVLQPIDQFLCFPTLDTMKLLVDDVDNLPEQLLLDSRCDVLVDVGGRLVEEVFRHVSCLSNVGFVVLLEFPIVLNHSRYGLSTLLLDSPAAELYYQFSLVGYVDLLR